MRSATNPLKNRLERSSQRAEDMISGLSKGKDCSLGASKKEEGQGEARETDPLLSTSAGRAHYQGSIRSRRSSRSPALPDSLMNPEDRYTANVASGTFTSNDAYTEGAYELHTDSETSNSAEQQQQQAQHAGLPQDSKIPPPAGDDRHVFHLRRTNVVYRPPGDNSSAQQDEEGEPPLLEISEEIYAVRKAALQVMKPLIGSWVRPLKALFLLSLNCQ